MTLQTITPAVIRSWAHWAELADDDRIEAMFRRHGVTEATPLEIADWEEVSVGDRLWLLLWEEIIPATDLRLFACWCLRRERADCAPEYEPGFWDAVDVAERVARGEATDAEMMEALMSFLPICSACLSDARMAAIGSVRDAVWVAWRAEAWRMTADGEPRPSPSLLDPHFAAIRRTVQVAQLAHLRELLA